MARGRLKQQQINVFLLKESVTSPEAALRDADHRPARHTLSPALGEGAMFTRSTPAHEPGWAAFVRGACPQNIGPLTAASSGALIVIKVDDRWFGISFGQGRHLLSPRSFERQFGLRAALNLADPDSLGAADSSEWDHTPKHRRTSTAKRANIRAFNLTEMELLRGVVGKPFDPAVGSQIAGRDAAMLWCGLSIADIPAKCRTLFSAFRQQVNTDDYPMVGHVVPIDDPVEQERLDQRLFAGLLNDALPFVELAPPEVVHWENVAGFTIPVHRRPAAPPALDMSMPMLEAVKPRPEWTLDWLKATEIVAIDTNDVESQSWPIYDCLLTEFTEGSDRFALFSGDWFRISTAFAEKIEREIQTIPIHQAYPFPRVHRHEREETFNERVAQGSAGRLLLLDQRNIRHGGGRSQVEVCDLLDLHAPTLYHIKDKFRSSGLSHLFTQASVSAELLREDAEYRQKVRDRHPAAAQWFPEADPHVEGYGIVLGIISTRTTPAVQQMPFLSKVRLDNLRKHLKRLGFTRLEIVTIPRA